MEGCCRVSGLEELFVRIVGQGAFVQSIVGGCVIAFLNMLGALAVLVWRRPSERSLDVALGFAAGVMLAASFTSLIIPGIERGSVFPVLAGIAVGALVLARADAWVPHVHVLVTGRLREDGSVPVAKRTRGLLSNKKIASAIFFIVAITLHNIPEGLAVGVGFGSKDLGNALSLMLAIGIQNIPEGLAVAIAARNAGLGTLSYAAFTGIRAGLVEIPLVVLGAAAVALVAPLLPYAMGFAAGGMLYVISDEIIPETHTGGNERIATLGTIVGVIVMVFLDVALT